MTYTAILYEVADGVATLTLNRPEVLNSLTPAMRQELLHALRRAEDEARCVVLTGAGRAFCAGQDLGQGRNLAENDLERTLIEEYHPLVEALAGHPLPTIAAVNGVAAGAGANLALACDVVIAAESAFFLQAFARIGLVPDAGGSYWLPRSMGLAKALGAALFADRITAVQAEVWGMIWEAIPDSAFRAHVARRAGQLAEGPTVAYRLMKQVIRASFARDLPAQLAAEAEAQGAAGRTRDHLEGVMAFREKRAARFEGR